MLHQVNGPAVKNIKGTVAYYLYVELLSFIFYLLGCG